MPASSDQQRPVPVARTLGSVVASGAIGIVGLDANGRISVINHHLTQLLARPADDLVGLTAHDALHPPGPEPGGCAFQAATLARMPTEIAGDSFVTGNGQLVPVTWIAAPLTDGGVTVIVRDDAEQRARAVVDAAVHEQHRAALADAHRSLSELEWLANLAETLSSTLDEDEVLRRLADVLAGRLADIAIVDRHDEGVGLRRVGGVAAPGVPVDVDALLAIETIGRTVPLGSTSVDTVLRGRPVRLRGAEIDNPAILGDSSRIFLAALGADSVLIAPLVARERVAGVFVLVRQAGSPPFDDADQALVLDIARRSALAVDNARLYREQRDIAVQLQHALLPPVTADLLVDTAARYLPARSRYSVGGDWYDRFRCPNTDDTTVLVVGDVAGHDLPAATSMAAIRNLLRGVVVATASSCADVVSAVDANLAGLDVAGTASALVMTVEPGAAGWTVRWCSAGHLPPVLLFPDGTAELLTDRHGPILGTGVPHTRGESARDVPAGSTLVLYTDGLVETREEDIEAGLERLRRSCVALAGLRDDPAALLADLVAHNHVADEDDTVILVCHLPVR